MLNSMHTCVAPVKLNLTKWNIVADDDVECEYREVQNVKHLTICGVYLLECTLDDLWLANTKAVDVAYFWAERAKKQVQIMT